VARLLVQLKLRLLGNALRSNRSAKVGFIISTYPVEKRVGSPAARAADGYVGYAFGDTFSSLLGVAAALSPVVVGVALTCSDPAAARMPVLLLCAAGYGLALAWTGVRIAARVADHRLPELFQIAVRSKL
jgi:ABC-2 type transport system permease protein